VGPVIGAATETTYVLWYEGGISRFHFTSLHYTYHFKLRCRTPKASASSSSPDAQRPLPLPWSVSCGDYLNSAPVKSRELKFRPSEREERVSREKADASNAYLLQVQRCLSRSRALKMQMHLYLQDTDSADSRTCIWTIKDRGAELLYHVRSCRTPILLQRAAN
jgi:hypothetical protein